MSWRKIAQIDPVWIGVILTLLIIGFSPNYGIRKFGPSPALPAALLCLTGLWLAWRERRTLLETPAMRRWLLLFLLLYVPILISVPGSVDGRKSIAVAAVLPFYAFTGLALIRALRDDSKRAWLASGTAAIVLFWAVDGLVQYAAGVDLFGVRIAVQNRVLGPFEGNVRLPVLLMLLSPLMLSALLPRRPAAAWAAFLVVGTVAMLNGSRTILPWLAMVAVGLFLRLPASRWKWPALAVMVAATTAVVVSSPALVGKLALLRDLGSLSFESIDRILTYRLTIWDTAMNMVADRPFSGVGVGAFASAYSHYALRPDDFFMTYNLSPYHAHQLYIGIAAETGLPGLVALCTAVVLGTKWYVQAPAERRTQAWPYALALFVYAFPVNSQPVPFTNWMFPVLVLLIGGMLAALDAPRLGRGEAERI